MVDYNDIKHNLKVFWDPGISAKTMPITHCANMYMYFVIAKFVYVF